MKAKIIFTVMLMSLMGISQNLKAQHEKTQAAIIYQLTRLVDWCPTGKQGNFIIGVLCDEHNLLNELYALNGRMVSSQKIEVKKFTNINQVRTANILFVSNTKTCDLPKIITEIGNGCTLIIADKEGAAKEGAAISFIQKDGQLKFEFSSVYAEKHSLSINNKILDLAENVF
ncbi:MAG: hypothetical protein CVT98_08635 [Bacteroidetes bacterium HGW-Bacteroidetes-15]|nr:MAG: hypothetical protein CVT98_08635 [Bacteroidetes bacterium HGW-Bacteroidetes-15]